jgi:hypothetical protein
MEANRGPAGRVRGLLRGGELPRVHARRAQVTRLARRTTSRSAAIVSAIGVA